MHVFYLVITVLAALANAYAASLNFVGAWSVKVVADRVQIPRLADETPSMKQELQRNDRETYERSQGGLNPQPLEG